MDKLKSAVILAAGKGLRMQNKFSCSKPMIPILGKPLITFILDALLYSEIERIITIYSSTSCDVLNINKEYPNIEFIEDKKEQGILSTINCASEAIKDIPFILSCADIIVQKHDLKKMLAYGINLHDETPDLFIPVVNNPSIQNEKPLTVKNGRVLNFNPNSIGNDKNAGGSIFLWYTTPFPLVKELIAGGTQNPSTFLQKFIKNHKVLGMPIADLWDVDTLEDVKETEKVLSAKIVDYALTK